MLDTFFADEDGDTYGDASNPIESCTLPEGYVSNDLDCSDSNAFAWTELAVEICDGEDNDCDEEVDEDDSKIVFFGMRTVTGIILEIRIPLFGHVLHPMAMFSTAKTVMTMKSPSLPWESSFVMMLTTTAMGSLMKVLWTPFPFMKMAMKMGLGKF